MGTFGTGVLGEKLHGRDTLSSSTFPSGLIIFEGGPRNVLMSVSFSFISFLEGRVFISYITMMVLDGPFNCGGSTVRVPCILQDFQRIRL